jgi:2-polyprenyl-3-methyl-5-hydroxy-6-metoxy-1,4-benzoquinol methylase
MQGENQYQESIKRVQATGHQRLGLMTTWAYHDDPKRLAFTFSRYKFVAKMLAGSESVLEVGCGDGFISRVVRQEVGRLKGVDFDPALIEDAKKNRSEKWPIDFDWHDMMKGPVSGSFDAAYALDVLEHIPAEQEDVFLRNMIQPVKTKGVVIIGMPSLQSQPYASQQSKEGHVNCKDQRDLRRLMQKYFDNVFPFAMNDEVLHTGYHAMAQYILMLCCGKKA